MKKRRKKKIVINYSIKTFFLSKKNHNSMLISSYIIISRFLYETGVIENSFSFLCDDEWKKTSRRFFDYTQSFSHSFSSSTRAFHLIYLFSSIIGFFLSVLPCFWRI